MKRQHWSTWYPGTESEWQSMPINERDHLSFIATGCSVAYPTWPAPTDCVHGQCRVLRGEIHPRVLANSMLRYELESGWLRFADRPRAAAIFRAIRTECRKTGEYDVWKHWQLIVYGGVT